MNCSCPSADILCYTMQECLFIQVSIALFLVVCKYFSLQVNFSLPPGGRFSHKVAGTKCQVLSLAETDEHCLHPMRQSQRQRQTHTQNYQRQRETPRQLHKHTQKVGKCRPPSAPSLWQRPMSGAGAMLCWSHAEYSKSQLTRHLGNFRKSQFFCFYKFSFWWVRSKFRYCLC